MPSSSIRRETRHPRANYRSEYRRSHPTPSESVFCALPPCRGFPQRCIPRRRRSCRPYSELLLRPRSPVCGPATWKSRAWPQTSRTSVLLESLGVARKMTGRRGWTLPIHRGNIVHFYGRFELLKDLFDTTLPLCTAHLSSLTWFFCSRSKSFAVEKRSICTPIWRALTALRLSYTGIPATTSFGQSPRKLTWNCVFFWSNCGNRGPLSSGGSNRKTSIYRSPGIDTKSSAELVLKRFCGRK